MAQRVLDKLEAERSLAMLNPDNTEKRNELVDYEEKVKILLDDSDRVQKEVKPSKCFVSPF